MRDSLKVDQVLGREEMKKIMAGSTNCVICENNHYCVTFNGKPPGPGCTWGECDC